MATKNNLKKNSNQISKSEQERTKELHKRELVAERHSLEAYSGPIPRPQDFGQYEKILPGSADRILAMAEKQSAHRQNLEKAAILSGIEDSKRGQYFAFIIAIVIILGGFWLVNIGKDALGFVAIVGSVGTLVSVFLFGRKSEREEREEKAKNE